MTTTTTATRPAPPAPVRHGAPDPRPLAAYAALMAGYTVAGGALALALRPRRGRIRRPSAGEFALLALATQRLTRLVAKDSVTSPLRAPFTRFEGPAGEGEVNEQVVGTGLRHAVGELVTCPFCLAPSMATGLWASTVALPTLGSAVVTILATAQASDTLQLAYAGLRHRQ